MRYFVTYICFDTSVDYKLLGTTDTIGYPEYQIVSPLENPAYADCATISDIEARFERLRNYQTNHNEVTFPCATVKVLRVEPLEESWFVKGWDQPQTVAHAQG
ncbi:hypothetical protein ACVW05_002034 [Pseudomonas fulva]